MRRLRFWIVIGALALATVAVLRHFAGPRIQPDSVLWLELSGEFVEAPETSLIEQLLGLERPPLLGVISQLRKAERDPRIAHVVVRVRGLEVGWAKAQELRDAITGLREAGRNPVALLEVDGFGSNLDYYVASAAEEVYLVPGGGAPLLGLGQEFFFLGGLWKHLDIHFDAFQAGRYKSAVENLVGEGMSEAFREQANSLLESIDSRFIADIATAREIAPAQLRDVIARAPRDPEELEAAGLVDGARTPAELAEHFGSAPRVDLRAYAQIDPEEVGVEPEATLAMIYGSGPIVSGDATSSRSGSPVLGADAVIEALENAADDAAISAIVLRVDSPGGAPFPSEQIWRAVRRARKQKPIVASFSDYAASGGYYLAAAADAVVAAPSTITGSIGVFAVRPSIGALLNRMGIAAEVSARAPQASLGFISKPLSPETRAWVDDDVRAVYQTFLERVGEGRGIPVDAVRAVAEGRVWTGEQAAERGLVDATTGLRGAFREAKTRAGLDPDADALVVIYPKPKPLWLQVREALGAKLTSALPLSPLEAVAAPLRVWLESLAQPGPAAILPFWMEIR